MKRREVSKAYVALAFHESRVEIGLLRQVDYGEGHLALRRVSLSQGTICAESGRVLREIDLRRCIKEVERAVMEVPSVEVMLGIPDTMCRTRTTRIAATIGSKTRSSMPQGAISENEDVMDIFPKRKTLGHEQPQEALEVSCRAEDINRYVAATVFDRWIVRVITPLMVARYNYLREHLSTAARDSLLIVHGCHNSCDIALWSNSMLRYRERLARCAVDDQWEVACARRVQEVAARIEVDYMVMVRATPDLAKLLEASLYAGRLVHSRYMCKRSLVYGETEGEQSCDFGHFDAARGLLAGVALPEESSRD